MARAMRAGPAGADTIRELSNRVAGRRRLRSRRLRLVAGTAALSLLTAACGQWEGAHQTVDERASKLLSASYSIPRNNGENSGAVPRPRRKVFTVKQRVPRSNGPLFMCPIQAEGYFADDFGAPRYAGGYHPHQGNDMFSDFGSPIVAPFDGRAEVAANKLGGLAVKVFGKDGYVYNAHLSRYGRIGQVKVGDVIGHVGNTGDAIGGPPHNHFEWHPRNGPAVDPNALLKEVCFR